VIAHWQFAGTGLLPELAHLADLLAATPKPRPEHPDRPRRARRTSDRAGDWCGPLTATVQTEATS